MIERKVEMRRKQKEIHHGNGMIDLRGIAGQREFVYCENGYKPFEMRLSRSSASKGQT
jgi:hypothetical protein